MECDQLTLVQGDSNKKVGVGLVESGVDFGLKYKFISDNRLDGFESCLQRKKCGSRA